MKLKKLFTAFTGILLLTIVLVACGAKKALILLKRPKLILSKLLVQTVAKLKFLKTQVKLLFSIMVHLIQFKHLVKVNQLSVLQKRKICLTT
jgi:hypothetical protein